VLVKRKSICFVLTSPFAVNAFLLNHFRVLADQFDLTLLVNTKEYPLSERLDPRVRVVDLPIVRKISPWQDLVTLVQLFRIFSNSAFDVVHSLTPKAGLLAMLSAWLAQVPLRIHTFTGQVWANKRGIARFGLKKTDSVIVFLASRVFADSESQCRFLESEGVVRAGGATVMGPGSVSGVDIVRFSPCRRTRREVRDRLGIPQDSIVFLALGRLNPDKGLLDLATAYKELCDQSSDAWLIVAGPDEAHMATTLQSRLGGCGRFLLVPAYVNSDEFLRASDVLVVPSYREGFGTVVLEAAATGIPAIASDIYGLSDAVVHKKTGLLVPVGSPAALKFSMLNMLTSPELRVSLGRQARDRAKKMFSDDAISLAWLSVYQQLVGR
jgi:glycosyltransferase involved in cell wall biosynthesis